VEESASSACSKVSALADAGAPGRAEPAPPPAQAAAASQLANALRVATPFSVHNGVLHGVDIAQEMLCKRPAIDDTSYASDIDFLPEPLFELTQAAENEGQETAASAARKSARGRYRRRRDFRPTIFCDGPEKSVRIRVRIHNLVNVALFGEMFESVHDTREQSWIRIRRELERDERTISCRFFYRNRGVTDSVWIK